MGTVIQPISNNPTRRFQLVELLIAANQAAAGARIYFKDQPQLRSQEGQTIYIQSMETYNETAVPVSFLSTNPVATVADMQNAALVLNISGREDLQLIPLVDLNRIRFDPTANPHIGDLFTTDDLYAVDWTKSYVQLAAAGTQTQFAYLFGVRYTYVPNIPPQTRLAAGM